MAVFLPDTSKRPCFATRTVRKSLKAIRAFFNCTPLGHSTYQTDELFLHSGQQPGLNIWRVEVKPLAIDLGVNTFAHTCTHNTHDNTATHVYKHSS